MKWCCHDSGKPKPPLLVKWCCHDSGKPRPPILVKWCCHDSGKPKPPLLVKWCCHDSGKPRPPLLVKWCCHDSGKPKPPLLVKWCCHAPMLMAWQWQAKTSPLSEMMLSCKENCWWLLQVPANLIDVHLFNICAIHTCSGSYFIRNRSVQSFYIFMLPFA